MLQIKGNRECSNMVGKDLGGGVKMSKFNFSEHGHVAYQIDPRPVPDPLGGIKGWDQKVKIQFFQNMVMLHIKLKGITDAATWLQYFAREPHDTPIANHARKSLLQTAAAGVAMSDTRLRCLSNRRL